MELIYHILVLLLLLSDYSRLTAVEVPKTSVISSSVITSSHYIQEFREKMDVGSSYGLSQPYLTSISDEIINLDIMKAISSLLEELDTSHQAHKRRNANYTLQNSTVVVSKRSKYIPNCYAYDYKGSPKIEIVNRSELMDILKSDPSVTNRSAPGLCVVLIVFAYTCPFSARAGPHLNALPRAFPQIRMVAIDAKLHQSLNSQYGVVGVPTVMLFHNGRPVAKFNRTDYTLLEFVNFLNEYTGIQPTRDMYVASTDFGGPLKTMPSDERDFHLIAAWTFLCSCIIARLFNRCLY